MYDLIRSNRKTLTLSVTPEATVLVRAPYGLPKSEIDRLVAAREPWIARQLAHQTQLKAQRQQFCLQYGGPVLYRGKTYTLVPKDDHPAGPEGDCFYVPEGLDSLCLMYCVLGCYRQLAKTVLAQRLAHFAPLMGVPLPGMRVTRATTRWGSCSSKGTVSFSWRLILAEDAAIDLVVVHELAHLKAFDHSPEFWALVATLLPDHAKTRQHLHALQQRLAGESWP